MTTEKQIKNAAKNAVDVRIRLLTEKDFEQKRKNAIATAALIFLLEHNPRYNICIEDLSLVLGLIEKPTNIDPNQRLNIEARKYHHYIRKAIDQRNNGLLTAINFMLILSTILVNPAICRYDIIGKSSNSIIQKIDMVGTAIVSGFFGRDHLMNAETSLAGFARQLINFRNRYYPLNLITLPILLGCITCTLPVQFAHLISTRNELLQDQNFSHIDPVILKLVENVAMAANVIAITAIFNGALSKIALPKKGFKIQFNRKGLIAGLAGLTISTNLLFTLANYFNNSQIVLEEHLDFLPDKLKIATGVLATTSLGVFTISAMDSILKTITLKSIPLQPTPASRDQIWPPSEDGSSLRTTVTPPIENNIEPELDFNFKEKAVFFLIGAAILITTLIRCIYYSKDSVPATISEALNYAVIYSKGIFDRINERFHMQDSLTLPKLRECFDSESPASLSNRIKKISKTRVRLGIEAAPSSSTQIRSANEVRERSTYNLID